jgi:hypothetical protein
MPSKADVENAWIRTTRAADDVLIKARKVCADEKGQTSKTAGEKGIGSHTR